ncbi:hypothetical protein D1872_330420 [compost metagenome]
MAASGERLGIASGFYSIGRRERVDRSPWRMGAQGGVQTEQALAGGRLSQAMRIGEFVHEAIQALTPVGQYPQHFGGNGT